MGLYGLAALQMNFPQDPEAGWLAACGSLPGDMNRELAKHGVKQHLETVCRGRSTFLLEQAPNSII